jgi:endoglycosylceramidase
MRRLSLGWISVFATIAVGSIAPSAIATELRSIRVPTTAEVAGPVHRVGPWLVDAQGRVVVLHGFNAVKKNPPFFPSRFGTADTRFLASEGFTVMRIGFIWEGVEPAPGQYDDAYIARVLQLDSLLARYGIRTVVDFHHDLWSRTTAGDGAPAWATLGKNFNDCFAAFWRDEPGPDGIGIQTRFVRAWEHVAHALRGHRNILALEPLNEPYPGSDYPKPCGPFTRCPEFEQGALAAFYRRVISAIRSGGAAQLILPEGVAESGNAPPVLPAFDDQQTAFTFHFYCPATQVSPLEVPVGDQSPEVAECAPIEERNIGRFTSYGSQLDVPAFLGEFSCNDVNPDNAQIVDFVARTFTSWTAWMYYTAPDDPANCPRQGLLLDDTRAGSQANAKQDKLDAFSVPYASAIAGTPESSSLDRTNRVYTLTYFNRAVPGARLLSQAPTVIFVPQRMYPEGYVAEGRGARIASPPNSRWLLLRAGQDSSVSVVVRPRSSTQQNGG